MESNYIFKFGYNYFLIIVVLIINSYRNNNEILLLLFMSILTILIINHIFKIKSSFIIYYIIQHFKMYNKNKIK